MDGDRVRAAGPLAPPEAGRPERRPGTAHPSLPADVLGDILFTRLRLGLAICDEGGRWLRVNPALAHALGYSHGGLAGRLESDLTPEEFLPGDRHRRATALKVGRYGPIEKALRHRQGYAVHVKVRDVCVDGPEGPVLLTSFEEVAEHKQTKEALRASEDRYRAFVETTEEWIWEIDEELRPTYVNPAVETLLGYSAAEFLTFDVFDLMHPDDRPQVMRVVALARRRKEGWSGQVIRWRHKDGGYREIESNARAILGPKGELEGWRGADRDVTEARKMQERLLEVRKLEAIGQLAGGIAHDFNNQLVAVLGHADLLRNRVPEHLKEHVDEIVGAGKRAADLTQQLLTFGRRQVRRLRVFDLNVVIADLHKLFERLIEEDIELAVSLADEPLLLEADRAQIEQVVVNLCTNARDAMPSGGTLTIGTCGMRHISRPGLTLEPGRYAVLTVADTGEGMDAHTAARLFEPFYTTKPKGKGTGLGLAIVYGIVMQHGGDVQFRTAPGEGTMFSIYLPLTDREPEPEAVLSSEVTGGSERILVVEDEPHVAATTAEVLRDGGYEVHVAHSGAEAIEAWDGGLEVDLVLTDVVMPQMSGFELARILKDRDPTLKVLYTSGYPAGDRERLEAIDRRSAYLQKPYESKGLEREIRSLLDR